MAKNEVDNRPGNGKGFNKGKLPEQFGPDDAPNLPKEQKNKIGGTPEPKKGKSEYTDAVLDYPDKSKNALNAVAMPNKKGKQVNKGIFDKISDYPTPIGGTPRPNKIV